MGAVQSQGRGRPDHQHYKILSKLGQGGMGVVYTAQDTRLDRPVELKFLAPHLVSNPDVRRRFEREAKAAK